MRPAAITLDAGLGAIAVAHDGARSIVTRASARPPLVVLEPRSHGGAAWIVAGTLGGGLVDGDRIAIELEVGAGATCVLATQAQAKIYRGASSQALDARVGDDALLVCAPDPVACYADARYRQDATISLAPRGSLVWLDGVTCGRRAHGERWAFARYEARVIVERDGRAILRDGLALDRDHAAIDARLGRFDALATIIALGPRAAPIASAWRAARTDDTLVAVSALEGDGAIARIAGTSVEAAQRVVRMLFAPLRNALGDDPFRGR
jgi:urease accessory protein